VGILKTLALRAHRICDGDNLNQELSHLRQVFKLNGYSDKQITKAINQARYFYLSNANHKPLASLQPLNASLPFVNGISQKIAKILSKKGLRVAFKPLSRIRSFVPSLKDSVDTIMHSGVYKILCSCGAPYIGETGRSFQMRIREHSADIKHDRVHKSALAEHSSSTKHHICLESTQILFKEDNFFKRKLLEAIEINHHPINLNRDDGWSLSQSWQPLLNSLDHHCIP
jgi:hypothetical protein